MKKEEKRFYTIDIVRGLAALSVLLSHWGGWTEKYANQFTKIVIRILLAPINFIWQGGGTHPGVVVFIVLSGFCIHLAVAKNDNLQSQLLNSTQLVENKFFWKKYFRRRMIRIYPVFWFALLTGLLVTFLINTIEVFNPLNLIASSLVSFMGLAGLMKFTGQFHYLYLGNAPLATVGVEILLYVSYPFYLKLYKLGGGKFILLFSASCYSIFVLMRFFDMPIDMSLASYFEFVPYWIWGAISAEIYSSLLNKKSEKNFYIVLAFTLSAIYLIVINTVKINGLYLLTTPILAVSSGLILALVLDMEVQDKRDFSKISLLSEIGARGYSIYAIHTPIIFFMMYVINYFDVEVTSYPILAMLMVVIATEFCYRIVEIPSHRLARKASV